MYPISDYLSTKLKVCSMLATIFVIYRHSFVERAFLLDGCNVGFLLTNTTRFVSTVTEVAVPLFFIISGMFFFRRNYYENNEYSRMLLKKLRTLFFPFIFWNLMGLIILLVSGKYERAGGGLAFLENFFLSYYYGPLWYVRDLMLLMLFSPMYLWIFNKKYRWAWGIVIPLLMYFWIPVDNRLMSIEGVLFFLFGGILNYRLDVLSLKFPKKYPILLFGLWMIIAFSFDLWEQETIHKISICLGILTIWFSIDAIPTKMYHFFFKISKYAFFIYVTHFYFVKTFKILIAHCFVRNELVAWLTFIFLPIICTWILIQIAHVFSKKYNRIYFLLTGNR